MKISVISCFGKSFVYAGLVWILKLAGRRSKIFKYPKVHVLTMFNGKVSILDGSYGFQLNKHMEKPIDDDPLWSAKALYTNPEAVIRTHMDYIEGIGS